MVIIITIETRHHGGLTYAGVKTVRTALAYAGVPWPEISEVTRDTSGAFALDLVTTLCGVDAQVQTWQASEVKAPARQTKAPARRTRKARKASCKACGK